MPPGCCIGLAGDLADELLLGGQCVLPDKADATGFTFPARDLARRAAASARPAMADDRQAFARSANPGAR